VESPWSSETPVTITVPIIRISPSDGTSFQVTSLYPSGDPIPTFSWSATGFIGYIVQFSSDISFKSVPVSVNVPATEDGLTPTKPTWQKVLAIPGKSGGNVYWRVVGKWSNKTVATSEIGFIMIDPPQEAKINSPIDGATIPGVTPPTFNFDTNCNIKFKLEFSPMIDFSDPKKVIGVVYTIANPVTQPVVDWTLVCTQWEAVWNLVWTGGYFRMKAWDAINRETVSEVRSFIIQSTLIGTWDITGKVSLTATIPGYGSETFVERFYDEFTFNPDGIFEMTDMTGTWTQRGSKFTVYLSRSEIEKYFEENLKAEFGTNVDIYGVTVSSTGKENCPTGTISGTVTFAMKMNIPAYGITGARLKAIFTLKGTRQSGSLLSMLEGVSPKEERLFLNTLREELSKIIRARRQL
jgi:hypothetical protein